MPIPVPGVQSAPRSIDEAALAGRLRAHVFELAGRIGERNIWRPEQLEQAAVYIESVFRRAGREPMRQTYEVRDTLAANIIVEIPGSDLAQEVIVVGAHYDSVRGCPGANDNGSGVAALLEIARLMEGRQYRRTMVLAAFVNEEPPFFLTRNMGSRVYAAAARAAGTDIVAMFSLETIGYYSDAPGSQRYPFPFRFWYPDTANFIGFVGNLASRRLVDRSLSSFMRHSDFPAEGLAAPGWFTGIGWSDQWSFWREGFPGVMITDTALFRYAPYHTEFDTPDLLVYEPMARVVRGVFLMLEELAGKE